MSRRLRTDQRSSDRTLSDVEARHRPQRGGRYGYGSNDATPCEAWRRSDRPRRDGSRCGYCGRCVAQGTRREDVFEGCIIPNTSPFGLRPLHDPPLKSRIKRRSCRPEPLAPESRTPLCFNHIAARAKREPRPRKLVAFFLNGRLKFEKQSQAKDRAHQSRGHAWTQCCVVKSLLTSAPERARSRSLGHHRRRW